MAPPVEPQTPQDAALSWIETVLERGDLAAAWERTDPQLRLVLAQDWVWTHRHDPLVGHDRDWDAIARGLAAFPPEHELWPHFSAELLATWHQAWKDFDRETWYAEPRPEVLDLDLELVTLVERDDRAAHPAAASFTRRFAMRHRDGRWLVAGVNGEQLFEPGWPPRMGRSSEPA